MSPWRKMSWPARLVAIPVYGYRWFISPLLPKLCRYEPSCSHFALEALGRHGALLGAWLTFRRMLRCHPFESLGGGSGYDPVPEAPARREKGVWAALRRYWEMGRSHDRRLSRRSGLEG